MPRPALQKRLLAALAAAVAAGAALAGPAAPAHAAGEDLQVRLHLCTTFVNTTTCAQDYFLASEPIPADVPFRRDFFVIHRPNTVVQSNFNVQIFRNATGGPVIARTKSVLLVDQQTGATLATKAGPQVPLAANVQASNTVTVSETSKPSQASGTFQITWHK
ncbi:hypothetical protein [Nonomuraea sp. NPDC050783]|uniref:hypothetical protein n=1 Tax=Nonomuraea sp. NPDC050783 TaxID=3154634 RepID=UPI003466E5C9